MSLNAGGEGVISSFYGVRREEERRSDSRYAREWVDNGVDSRVVALGVVTLNEQYSEFIFLEGLPQRRVRERFSIME